MLCNCLDIAPLLTKARITNHSDVRVEIQVGVVGAVVRRLVRLALASTAPRPSRGLGIEPCHARVAHDAARPTLTRALAERQAHCGAHEGARTRRDVNLGRELAAWACTCACAWALACA